MSPSDPDPPGSVYGFPVPPPPPAPEAPPMLNDGSPSSGNHCSLVSKYLTMLWQDRYNWLGWSALLIVFAFLGFVCYMIIASFAADKSPRVSVSSMSLSSFDVSQPSRQLNGTWHVDFSLRYKDETGTSFSCRSAAVSVYYKGSYLAGTDLHAFVVTPKPTTLEANVDASRTDVPGWLASDLAEARRLGFVEFDVQFVIEEEGRYTYLCGGLRLGFSTKEEAVLIGDGHVRCPFVA